MSNYNKARGFIILRVLLVLFSTILVMGVILGVYAYSNADERAIQKYQEIYQQLDIKAFEAFVTNDYQDRENYKNHKTYFQENTEISVDLNDPNIEVSYKKNRDAFVLRRVPFTVKKGYRKIRVFRDITFRRVGLFKYALEDEDYPVVDDASSYSGGVEKLDLAFQEALQKEMQEKLPTSPRDIVKQVLATLNHWKVAWTTGDLDTYMSVYSNDARILRVTVNRYGEIIRRHFLTKAELRKRMEKLYRQYKYILVEIYNPEIIVDTQYANRIEEIQVVARFEQLYSAGKGVYKYTDFGYKKMRFRYEDEEWKIFEESWEPHKVQMTKLREIFPELFQN